MLMVHETSRREGHLAKYVELVALRAALWKVWLPMPGATGNVLLIQLVTCACTAPRALLNLVPKEVESLCNQTCLSPQLGACVGACTSVSHEHA